MNNSTTIHKVVHCFERIYKKDIDPCTLIGLQNFLQFCVWFHHKATTKQHQCGFKNEFKKAYQ
jgi:hypothetical protein